MSIDPADDCTFWYTGEYIPSTGVFNWRTRIASFTLPGCAAATADSFSLALVPASLTVVQGASDSAAVNTAITSGAAQSIDLNATGAPYHTTISFTPPTINSGDSTSMNVDVGDDTPAGTYTISVRGTGPKDIETATFTLTVKQYNAVVNGDFENGLTGWTASGRPRRVVPKPSKKGKPGPSPRRTPRRSARRPASATSRSASSSPCRRAPPV